ncbi:MAG: hypothetical protein NTU74_15430 [Deltaproteobacteria bacterium]|nr:hypothetical protein [Deltaproteobacteria bacterium]
MRKIILINVFSIIISFIFFLAVGEAAFDLKDFYEKNRDNYGDVPLETVARDVFDNTGMGQDYDYNDWKTRSGFDPIIEEDNRQRAAAKSQDQGNIINMVASHIWGNLSLNEALIFIITGSIGLAPPLVIRYAIMKRPITMWPAIGTCFLFFMINCVLFTAIDSQNKKSGAFVLIALASYWILRRGTATKVINVSAQRSGSSASFVANSTNSERHIAIQHIAKGAPASSPDRKLNNVSPAGRLDVAVDEERIYAAIATELETGATDKGLWTRLFAECSGDEKQMKVLYIKQRAERLISAKRIAVLKVATEKATAERLIFAKRIAVEKAATEKAEADLIAAEKVKVYPAYCPGCQKRDVYRDVYDEMFCPNCKNYVKYLL